MNMGIELFHVQNKCQSVSVLFHGVLHCSLLGNGSRGILSTLVSHCIYSPLQNPMDSCRWSLYPCNGAPDGFNAGFVDGGEEGITLTPGLALKIGKQGFGLFPEGLPRGPECSAGRGVDPVLSCPLSPWGSFPTVRAGSPQLPVQNHRAGVQFPLTLPLVTPENIT